jgi:uncharacterized protein
MTRGTMADIFTTRAASHAVPSPCVAICTMNPASDFCDGCQRTIGEIASWSDFSNSEKQQVWLRIGERRARAALASNSGTDTDTYTVNSAKG